MINVAEDFSRFPAGRTTGPANGAAFRDSKLIPALQRSEEMVEVNFDGVVGLPSSFLEEVFGGLVRAGIITSEMMFMRRVRVTATRSNIRRASELVSRYVVDAIRSNAR